MLVILGVSVTVSAGKRRTCESLFKTAIDQTETLDQPFLKGRQPRWADWDPRKQFKEWGVLFADWAPKLTPEQIEEIHDVVSRAATPRGAEQKPEIFLMPGEPLPFSEATSRALAAYIEQLESFVGLKGRLVFRTEAGLRVAKHKHGPRSVSTASIALMGPGSFAEIKDQRFYAATMQTMLFRDGPDGIFHGTPVFRGRRLFFAISFYREP